MIVVYAYNVASHSLGAVLHSGRVLASSGTDFQHRLPAHILVVSSLRRPTRPLVSSLRRPRLGSDSLRSPARPLVSSLQYVAQIPGTDFQHRVLASSGTDFQHRFSAPILDVSSLRSPTRLLVSSLRSPMLGSDSLRSPTRPLVSSLRSTDFRHQFRAPISSCEVVTELRYELSYV